MEAYLSLQLLGLCCCNIHTELMQQLSPSLTIFTVMGSPGPTLLRVQLDKQARMLRNVVIHITTLPLANGQASIPRYAQARPHLLWGFLELQRVLGVLVLIHS